MGNEEYHCKLCYNATGTYKCHNVLNALAIEWNGKEKEGKERKEKKGN